jgi:hypothetical protein
MGGYQNTVVAAAGATLEVAAIIGGTLNCICMPSSLDSVAYSFIGGGYENRIYSGCNQSSLHNGIGGGLQNLIRTYTPGGKSAGGNFHFIGGGRQNCLERTRDNTIIFGGCNNTFTSSVNYAAIFGGGGLNGIASNYSYGNYLYKTSGKFSINHPDPEKAHTHKLVHSFVEAPTTGENLYRFEVSTEGCAATVCLPSYYKFLNCNDQVWITPKDHMGVAYGNVNQEQTEINIVSNCDASYYVLLIGTRKDEKATFRWRGVEQDTIIPN